MQNAFAVISVATKSICVTAFVSVKRGIPPTFCSPFPYTPRIYWKIKCICAAFPVVGEIDWFCCDSNCNWKYLLTISLVRHIPPLPALPTSSSVGTCLPASAASLPVHISCCASLVIPLQAKASRGSSLFLISRCAKACQLCVSVGGWRGGDKERKSVCGSIRYNSRKAFWQCAPHVFLFLCLGILYPVLTVSNGIHWGTRCEYRFLFTLTKITIFLNK